MTPNEVQPHLETLLQSTRSLRNGAGLDSYLQALVNSAAALTRSQAAALLVSDEPGTQFRVIACPAQQMHDAPLAGSVAGRVYESGTAETIRGAAGEPARFAPADQVTGIETRTLAAVPLVFKDQKLGVLTAINRLDGADYTEEDVHRLDMLAAQASLLLHNDRLEKKLGLAAQEVDALDRMKRDFIAIASHELRTPLGLILGHATFLRELVDEAYHDQLDTIIRSATRLKGIIESLSSVDNVQSGAASLRRRMVSIRRLVDDVTAAFKEEAAAKNITLQPRHCPADLWVDGDAEKLHLALSNLVQNALQFTEPGGQIMVRAESVPGYAKITVTDTGIGIPAADLARIFERFYQVQSHLTRTHGGMGLGLSVTRAMVELHNGRVWAESVEGQGSHFIILLPLDPAPQEATPPPIP